MISAVCPPARCLHCRLARAMWPVSLPFGDPSSSYKSGRCETHGSPSCSVIIVTNGYSRMIARISSRSRSSNCFGVYTIDFEDSAFEIADVDGGEAEPRATAAMCAERTTRRERNASRDAAIDEVDFVAPLHQI